MRAIVQIRKRNTFDSSATPKPGERKRNVSGSGAKPDLEKYASLMRETIERAKEDNPKILKARILELEKKLSSKSLAPSNPVNLDQAIKKALDGARRDLEKWVQGIQRITDRVARDLEQSAKILTTIPAFPSSALEQTKVKIVPPPLKLKPESEWPRPTKPVAHIEGNLPKPEQRILDALAWLEAIGVLSPENAPVAFLAGYSATSTSYTNPRAKLSTLGLIDYPSSGRVRLTQAGRDAANFPDQPGSNEDLHRMILTKLGKPETRLLTPLLEMYPSHCTNEKLAGLAGYSPTSTSYTNPRATLSTLGLIEYPQSGLVRARDILFPLGK